MNENKPKSGKGHPNYYKGKKDTIDMAKFGNALNDFMNNGLTIGKFAKQVGVSVPTLQKHFEYWCVLLEKQIRSGDIVSKNIETGEITSYKVDNINDVSDLEKIVP